MNTALRSFVAVTLLVAGFLLGAGWTGRSVPASAPAAQEQSASASVLIDTGSELLGFQDVAIPEAGTVLSLFDGLTNRTADLSIATESYGDIGTLVTSINGYTNGTDGKYWQFWVNNNYAEVAADKYFVGGGDVIMWKFTSARFSEY